ncbi:MAG: extracellular solute-binding protein [Pseudonocardiaceae bacterium]
MKPWFGGMIIGVVVTLVVTFVVGWIGGGVDELEAGKLVILSGRDDSAGDQRQALIDAWNATHPQQQARIEELPPQADAAHSEMVARAQSGDHDVDIYNLDVTWTAEFADEGYIQPLDAAELDTTGFLPNTLETCRYERELYALPFNTDAGLLYYRDDLVSPFSTWPSIRAEFEKAFAPRQDPALLAGYTGQLGNYEGLTVNALEAMQAAAGGSVVRDNEVVVDLAVMNDGLDRLRPTSGDPQFILPESLEYDETASTEAFGDRKVLFMRNWPVAYRQLSPAIDGDTPDQQLDFRVVPLPGPSVLGGQNLAIAENSDEPQAAQALIEFLTDARSQQLLFERGGFAATREIVYRDAAVIERYPYSGVLLEAVQHARPRPVIPCYAQFTEFFHDTVHTSLRNRAPLPGDFVSHLDDVMNC